MKSRGTIEVEIQSEETAIVTLHGEHDMATTAGIAVALAVAAGCPSVLVDVSDSTFIDSTVISAILRAAKGASTLELVAPKGRPARRGLDLTGVGDLIPIHDTRDAGIASVEAAARQREPGNGRPDARTVSAKVVDLQARTRGGRARIATTSTGVVIVRAKVGELARAAARSRRVA